MKNFADVKNKSILVDTNILVNCGDNRYGEDFKRILRVLFDNENELGSSVISGFEIIKKYHKKSIFSYYIDLLNYIKKVPVSVEISNNAGKIANYLGKNKDKKDNDFIIGASVVSFKNSFLLTCDRKDFEKPYWGVVARECVCWEDEETDKKQIFNIFLLKPDRDKFLRK